MTPPDDQFGFPAMPPENVTPGQLLLILQSMHGQITALRQQRERDQEQLAELVAAWNNAKGVVSVMKFLAFVGGTVAALYAMWHGALQYLRGS